MKHNDLKRLRRSELLELYIEERNENEELRTEIEILKKQLEDRIISIDKFGSLAEASLGLAKVFEACDRACELYKENYKASIIHAINSAVDNYTVDDKKNTLVTEMKAASEKNDKDSIIWPIDL